MNIKQLHLKALQFNPAWADVLIARNDTWLAAGGVQTVPVAKEVITDCFAWDQTPEGVDFWCAVAVALNDSTAESLCQEFPTVESALAEFERRKAL